MIYGKKINYQNIIEYDLSEIVFQAKDQNDLRSKVNKIRLDVLKSEKIIGLN